MIDDLVANVRAVVEVEVCCTPRACVDYVDGGMVRMLVIGETEGVIAVASIDYDFRWVKVPCDCSSVLSTGQWLGRLVLFVCVGLFFWVLILVR